MTDPTTDPAEVRAATLTDVYWRLRGHADILRDTTIYRDAEERSRMWQADADRYHWLEANARGIETAARTVAALLGVPEDQIERPPAPPSVVLPDSSPPVVAT